MLTIFPSDLKIHPLRQVEEGEVDTWVTHSLFGGKSYIAGGRVTRAWRTADGLFLIYKDERGWSASECDYTDEWNALSESDKDNLSLRADGAGAATTRGELIERLTRNAAVAGEAVSWRTVDRRQGLHVSRCERFALLKMSRDNTYHLMLQESALTLAEPGLDEAPISKISGMVKECWQRELAQLGAAGPYTSRREAAQLLNAALTILPSLGSRLHDEAPRPVIRIEDPVAA